MAEQPNAYDAVIADLRAKRDQIDQTIALLEALREGVAVPAINVGQPATGVSALVGYAADKDGELAAGTFHGMSIEAAVKKLLQMRKRTMTAQELAQSLRAGGLHLQSDTPANTIASVLSRAFNGGSDIVRVSRGQWGLQEWYPTQRFKRSED
jgi:HB1, ASXL, restriction endonuclease HTH domain